MTTNILFITIILFVFVVTITKYFKIKSTNEKLQKQIRLLEAEKLKFQLQPHTLRNIFSELQVFANKLNKGIESITCTLEYIFHKGKNNYVTIDEELEFIKKYIALNDLFLYEIDAIKLDYSNVDQKIIDSSEFVIPHLISASFIENAFKHGDKKHPEFLRITIVANSEYFEFKTVNKIKPTKTLKPTTGLGLENLKKRLDIFAPNKYEIRYSCNEEEYHSVLKIKF